MKILLTPFFGNQRSTFSLIIWNSFKTSLSLHLFILPSVFSHESSTFVSICINRKEIPKAYIFEDDLLNFRKEEVKVNIEDDQVLQIIGERHVGKEDKDDFSYQVEHIGGKFAME